tara:strand:- start:18039 stop:18170 length:132 start_codon:yes stop_codon:yes gene_type:complete
MQSDYTQRCIRVIAETLENNFAHYLLCFLGFGLGFFFAVIFLP